MKLLTVVIPTYNMAALLPRCLDSLTKPNLLCELEVLVVNDGSKDNSLEIAQEYEAKYPGIIYAIDKPNGNYGSTINKGIELATGKYFRICDSDDFYDNLQLTKLLEYLKDTDADLILNDYVVDRQGHHALMKISSLENKKIYNIKDVDLSYLGNYAMHGLVIKTQLLQQNNIRLLTGISYTDTEICYYPLQYAKTLLYVNYPIYHYQVGRDGQTVSLSSQLRCLSHMKKIIDRMFDDISAVRDDNILRNKSYVFYRILNLYFSTALCYDRTNGEIENLKEIDGKIQNYPDLIKRMKIANMFGVHFYNRFHQKQKTSNSIIFSLYYNLVKKLLFIYRLIK